MESDGVLVAAARRGPQGGVLGGHGAKGGPWAGCFIFNSKKFISPN